ncbi:MAG: hypothetical protein JO247_11325 [Chloroflexi bacterium]|nr:hypothetical protein [Chloroflexota bacterium]
MSAEDFPPGMHDWCGAHLGSYPQVELFRHVGMAEVFGLRLADGREVVVKVRRAEARLAGCFEAQRRLREAGYPCPEPLVGPARFGAQVATAETYVVGGEASADPQLSAPALAELVRLAPSPAQLPSIEPLPAWAWWSYPGPGVWAWQSAPELDLAAKRGWRRDGLPLAEMPWLEEHALGARQRLARFRAEPVVGHTDWWGENVRWLGDKLHVVHDWDSVAALPEALTCGIASSMFVAWPPTAWPSNMLELSTAFVDAYARARGRPWSADEWEACWAASLWVMVYDLSYTSEGVTDRAEWLRSEAEARLRLSAGGLPAR